MSKQLTRTSEKRNHTTKIASWTWKQTTLGAIDSWASPGTPLQTKLLRKRASDTLKLEAAAYPPESEETPVDYRNTTLQETRQHWDESNNWSPYTTCLEFGDIENDDAKSTITLTWKGWKDIESLHFKREDIFTRDHAGRIFFLSGAALHVLWYRLRTTHPEHTLYVSDKYKYPQLYTTYDQMLGKKRMWEYTKRVTAPFGPRYVLLVDEPQGADENKLPDFVYNNTKNDFIHSPKLQFTTKEWKTSRPVGTITATSGDRTTKRKAAEPLSHAAAAGATTKSSATKSPGDAPRAAPPTTTSQTELADLWTAFESTFDAKKAINPALELGLALRIWYTTEGADIPAKPAALPAISVTRNAPLDKMLQWYGNKSPRKNLLSTTTPRFIDTTERTIDVLLAYLENLNMDNFSEPLEKAHGFIQYLFPNREHSDNNPTAPLLTNKNCVAFRDDEDMCYRLLRSLLVMLDWYGLGLDGKTVVVCNPGRLKQNFTHHNFPRCTRIQNALYELGFIDIMLLDDLKEILPQHGILIMPGDQQYWDGCTNFGMVKNIVSHRYETHGYTRFWEEDKTRHGGPVEWATAADKFYSKYGRHASYNNTAEPFPSAPETEFQDASRLFPSYCQKTDENYVLLLPHLHRKEKRQHRAYRPGADGTFEITPERAFLERGHTFDSRNYTIPLGELTEVDQNGDMNGPRGQDRNCCLYLSVAEWIMAAKDFDIATFRDRYKIADATKPDRDTIAETLKSLLYNKYLAFSNTGDTRFPPRILNSAAVGSGEYSDIDWPVLYGILCDEFGLHNAITLTVTVSGTVYCFTPLNLFPDKITKSKSEGYEEDVNFTRSREDVIAKCNACIADSRLLVMRCRHPAHWQAIVGNISPVKDMLARYKTDLEES